MLWTNTHELTDITHLFEAIRVKDLRFTISSVDEASEYRYGCCLPSTIVTEQRKDLATVHFHIQAFDSLKISKVLSKVFNAKVVTKLFLSLADQRRSFIIIVADISPFKFIIFFCWLHVLVSCLLSPLSSLASAACVRTWQATKDRGLALTKFDRKNIVKVKSNYGEHH